MISESYINIMDCVIYIYICVYLFVNPINVNTAKPISPNIFSGNLTPERIKLEKMPKMEFKEFEPRFKSAKTRFKLSAGLNLETFDTILSGPIHI